MATKKRGLIQKLFGSKKTSFDSISADDEDVAALQALRSSSAMFGRRRHTIDVETFGDDTSEKALIAAAGKRHVVKRQSTDVNYGCLLRRLCSRSKQHRESSTVQPETTLKRAATTEDFATASAQDDVHKSSGSSLRRRAHRRDRLLRCVTFCRIDPSQPIIYPTTPETILEYHKAMPFLDENEEWLMVELNEYECLVDGIEIIKIIANHSKFFEVEPDELWEEFFEFVDDVPAYDEVINFDVWQEFRDKKYTC